MNRRSWTLIALAVLPALAACSLSALDGFSSPAGTGVDAGSSVDASEPREVGATPPAEEAGVDGANPVKACVPSVDTICASFDEGPLETGWNVLAGSGGYTTGVGRSPPNAVLFSQPNSGAAASGPRFGKTFDGAWSRLDCTFAAALDEIPDDGANDIATAASELPTLDDVGLRVTTSGFRLISCRDDSDCRPEVQVGALPKLGEFHDYRLEWLGDGTYRFSLDGVVRGTTKTKATLAAPSQVTVHFGLVYRAFGSGGAFRVRHDDIVCTRTP